MEPESFLENKIKLLEKFLQLTLVYSKDFQKNLEHYLELPMLLFRMRNLYKTIRLEKIKKSSAKQ